jgi:hypothetical protein
MARTGTQRGSAQSDCTELSAAENRSRSEERRRWFREGRCPWCGELGPFVQGAPVCSTHGPYPFVKEPDPADGMDPAEVEPEEPADVA